MIARDRRPVPATDPASLPESNRESREHRDGEVSLIFAQRVALTFVQWSPE